MTPETLQRLELPPDPDLVERLKAKLEEYRKRNRESYRHPDLRQASLHKEKLLEKLIDDGSVDLVAYEQAARGRSGDSFDLHSLYTAAGVIHAYCTGDPDGQLRGGTGLPALSAA